MTKESNEAQELIEAILQALLILAFLAIGLISVIFPMFSIAAEYLSEQEWEPEKEPKGQKEDLADNPTQASEESRKQANEAKKQIGCDEPQSANLCPYLTASGAVLTPVLFLLASLFFDCLGIYAFYKDMTAAAIPLGAITLLWILAAMNRMFNTIRAIEYAAIRRRKRDLNKRRRN